MLSDTVVTNWKKSTILHAISFDKHAQKEFIERNKGLTLLYLQEQRINTRWAYKSHRMHIFRRMSFGKA